MESSCTTPSRCVIGLTEFPSGKIPGHPNLCNVFICFSTEKVRARCDFYFEFKDQIIMLKSVF